MMVTVLSDIVAYLTCPVCSGDLSLGPGALRCASGHSFDIARQGYVNLLSGGAQAGTADTAAMVEARAAFLAEGHFASLAALLADRVAATDRTGCPERPAHPENPGLIVDAGAGTGYYLSAALDRCPSAVGAAIDISKFALRRAARAHPRIGAVVADMWGPLPVRSDTARVVLNVFAPRNPAEFRRILRPDGALLVVTPTARHLREVVRPLQLLAVDDDKTRQLDAALGEHFSLVDRDEHEVDLLLSHQAVETLVLMGPSAWHRTAADVRRRLADLTEFTESTDVTEPTEPTELMDLTDPAETIPVTASFTVSAYRPIR